MFNLCVVEEARLKVQYNVIGEQLKAVKVIKQAVMQRLRDAVVVLKFGRRSVPGTIGILQHAELGDSADEHGFVNRQGLRDGARGRGGIGPVNRQWIGRRRRMELDRKQTT